MEIWGNRRPVGEVFAELIRDEPFFGEDGGVTVSGGEACLQALFVRELLGRLHTAGIGTALDTCGVCTPEQFDATCEFADLILYDLKDSDPVRHERNVGGSLERVRSNFRRAIGLVSVSSNDEIPDSSGDRAQGEGVQEHRRQGKRLWVRTPIIPGMTDSEDNVRGIARFLVSEAQGRVERWELCAFNNLCSGKYRSLGRTWELEGSPLVRAAEMGALVGAAVAEGWPADRIRWTGMTRHES
jgi:pyruvate formate lyase activating enzyme